MIASGKVPAKKVYEDEKFMAVLDINPARVGHILVLTKQHATIMPQLDEQTIAELGIVAKKLSHKILGSLDADGTSIFSANGAAAGQRAPHFILHVIPRKAGDGVTLDLPEKQLDEKLMKETYDALAAVLSGKKPAQAPGQPQAQPSSDSSLDDISKMLTGGK